MGTTTAIGNTKDLLSRRLDRRVPAKGSFVVLVKVTGVVEMVYTVQVFYDPAILHSARRLCRYMYHWFFSRILCIL